MRNLETIVQDNYKNLELFVRDSNLDSSIIQKYQEGMILTDPSFIDMTYQIGGMNPEKNIRFVILSNRASNMHELEKEEGLNWGLYVIHTHAYFKVLKNFSCKEKSIVLLLHILEEDISFFFEHQISIDDTLIQQVKEKMETSLDLPVINELDQEIWYKRVQFPIGIKDNGDYFKAKEEL